MPNNTVFLEELIEFDSKLFVDRKKAIQIFLETIRHSAGQVYLEFTGVAGQGKTELLKRLCYEAKDEGYCPVYVDFDFAAFYRPELSPVLQHITECLAAQIAPNPFQSFQECCVSFEEIYQQYLRASLKDSQAAISLKALENERAQTFNENLRFLLSTHKVLLCLDSTEKAHRPTLQNFEEHVIKHHTNNQNFMIVTAGQEPFVWKNAGVKRLIDRYTLTRFDRESVHEQLKKLSEKKGFHINDSELISDKVAQLTLGHPFSSYTLIDFWTDGFKGQLNKIVVENRFKQSVHKLSEHVLEERILAKFQLSEEYPPVKQVLRYLAPLRCIELSTFRYVLCTFWGDQFEGKPFTFFHNLIGEFHNTYIFRWIGDGYSIDPVVRNILLWDMRTNALELFLQMQEKLEQQYEERISRTHEATQIKNIVERLYHYSIYLKVIQPNYDPTATIQTEVQRYLKTYFTTKFVSSKIALHDQLDRFYNTLKKDEDLADMINISALLEEIDAHRDTIK